MVRIRVKINDHSGQPKKPCLVKCICDADASINKIVESKEAFFLITDNLNMDILLGEDSRARFPSKGLEIQFPPEYEAARTIMLRNVDNTISQLTEAELVKKIEDTKNLKVKKLIKIPNSSHLIKIMFQTTEMADQVVEKGVKIGFQYFQKNNVEKEMFVSIVPCYRCYEYGHIKKNCPKPVDYKVCSNCAQLGHIYSDCHAEVFKCINCRVVHRTLAAKCKVRKKIIREKVKERRDRSRSRVARGMDSVPNTAEILKTKLPENYLAVMAATITLADKRETEYPGSYQFVVDEMLKANGIPLVKFPDTVVSDSQSQYKQSETRKRQRSHIEEEMPELEGIEIEVASQSSQESDRPRPEYVLAKDGTWRLQLPKDIQGAVSPTPIHTPETTPAPTPTHTPIVTPVPTPPSQSPTQTPSTSPKPKRDTGAVAKRPQERKSGNPLLMIIVRTYIVYPANVNNQTLKKDIGKEKTMKYIYANPSFNSEALRRDIKAGKIDLTRLRRVSLAPEHFHMIKSGGLYKAENIEKYARR